MSETVQKPGAAAASAALRSAALEQWAPLQARISEAAKAVIALRQAEDLILVMDAVNRLSLTAEALTAAAEELHKAADKALVAAMSDTGCTQIASGGLTVSLRQNPPSVEITGDVPDELMSTPKAAPDRNKIRAFLKGCAQPVNWARLTNGSLGLQRRAS